MTARLPLPTNAHRQFAVMSDIQTQRIICVRSTMTVLRFHRFESFTSQKIDYHNPNSISNKFGEKRPCTFWTYRVVGNSYVPCRTTLCFQWSLITTALFGGGVEISITLTTRSGFPPIRRATIV